MVAFRGAGCVAGDGGGVGGDGRGCDGCVRRGRWWRSSVGRGGRLGGRCRIGARSGRRWPRRRPSIRSVSPLLGAERRAYLVGVVRVPPVSVVWSLAYVRVSLETPNQQTAVLPVASSLWARPATAAAARVGLATAAAVWSLGLSTAAAVGARAQWQTWLSMTMTRPMATRRRSTSGCSLRSFGMTTGPRRMSFVWKLSTGSQ